MLGKALRKELRDLDIHIYCYSDSFDWVNIERIKNQFKAAADAFFASIVPTDEWEVYWVAGAGSMGSNQSDLENEVFALDILLTLLGERLSACRAKGVIGFASSAGALYSGCTDFEVTEASIASSSIDYAKIKIMQEQMLENFASSNNEVKVLIARFSTLYGPGQALGKRQGLISHIARCALKHQIIEIFVPFDTSRDYLFIDDAARDFAASIKQLHEQDNRIMIKIIAAERSITIAEVVSTFNRLLKKNLRIVCNRNNLSNLYASRVAYRSIMPRTAGYIHHRTTLLEGVATLLQSERVNYIKN